MNVLEHTTIGEYVAKDFRAAAVFSKSLYGSCFFNSFKVAIPQAMAIGLPDKVPA